MPDYILDTHACLYALIAPKKLGAHARKALRRVERGGPRAWIPAAVVAEIVLLHELGRTAVGLAELREVFAAASNFSFLPLDLSQLDHFSAHGVIRDPFDRLIVAATRSLHGKLLTKDQALADFNIVPTVW